MNIGLATQRLTSIHLDFDVSLEFDAGCTIALSEFALGDELIDEDNQFEGMRLLAPLVGSVCVRAEYDLSGRLTVEFDSGIGVTAGARDEVESWEFTAANGATILCEAGGEVVTFPAPDDAPDAPLHPGFPGIDATAVKISIGSDPRIEFSDGSRLPIDLDLDDAYLVLREKVVAVREGATRTVELSSGYKLSGT